MAQNINKLKMKNAFLYLFYLILQSVLTPVYLFRTFYLTRLLLEHDRKLKLQHFAVSSSKLATKADVPSINQAESLFKWTFHKYPQDFIVRCFIFLISLVPQSSLLGY
jgi:hypothetical protein